MNSPSLRQSSAHPAEVGRFSATSFSFSGSGEIPDPALRDSPDAFLMIVRLLQAILITAFLIRRFLDRIRKLASKGRPNGHHCQRRVLRNLAGKGESGIPDFSLGNESVQDPEFQRLFATKSAPGKKDVRRRLLTDEPRQHVRQSESRAESELDEIGCESGFRATDPEVRHHRQAESSAHRSALDGRDDGLSVPKKPNRLPVERVSIFRSPLGARLSISRRTKVRTGAEMFTFRSQYDRTTIAVFVQRFEGIRQSRNQLLVEKIIRRPLNLAQRHEAACVRHGHVSDLSFHLPAL